MGFLDKLKQTFTGNKENDKYLSGFGKTSESIGHKLAKFKIGFKGVSDEFLEELMIVLLESDIGIETADKICQIVDSKCKKQFKISYDEVMDILIETMSDIYNEYDDKSIVFNDNGTTVIMLVGVNGSGKTTSCAKLARKYLDLNYSVAVVAADTFRAGATEQLEAWANKLNIPIIKGKENQDPSSVLVDGCRYAKEHDIQILLCDTAGRLQNKTNLMNELAKMKKVVSREIEGAPHNTWLVLDSSTGQNGLSQAKLFNEVTDLTGIILTKMDGTSKGGIIVAIKNLLHIPVLFVGLGENEKDLQEFNLQLYLYSISKGINDAR